MAKVKRANRILTVNDKLVDDYLKRGYDQIDDKGKVLKSGSGGSIDAKTAKKLEAAERANAKLKEENEALKAELEAAKKPK